MAAVTETRHRRTDLLRLQLPTWAYHQGTLAGYRLVGVCRVGVQVYKASPAATSRMVTRRMLLGDGASTALVRRMVEIGTRDVLRKNVSPEEGRTVPAEVAAHHLVVSSIALIRWWLENGMSYSPGRVGEIYHALIERPTRVVAFDTQPSWQARILRPHR